MSLPARRVQFAKVAGWREIKDSPLPCVGLQEVTSDFTPFTGRRTTRPSPPRRGGVLNILGDTSHAHHRHRQPSLHHRNAANRENTIRGRMTRPRSLALGLDFDDDSHCSITSPLVAKSLICDGFEPLASRLHSFHNQTTTNQSPRQISFPLPSISADRRHFLRHRNLSALSSVSESDQDYFKTRRRSYCRDNSENGEGYESLDSGCLSSSLTSDVFLLDSPQSASSSSSSLSSSASHPSVSAMAYNNSPPISPSVFPPSPFSSSSIFSISQQEAAAMVRRQDEADEGLGTYLIQVKLRPLFCHDLIPGTCLRKLPRLINGIPLGAGFLSRDQLSGIKWLLIEGGHSTLTFISTPIKQDEAEESRTCFRESLVKQSQAVFGDMTIKASLMLTKCIKHDEDFMINDIAVSLEEGLQFRD